MNDLTPGQLTPSQWFDLKRNEILKELGIQIDSVVAATPDSISSALGRAGRMIRERYGEDQFQGELGQKIREDLKNAFNGGTLTIVDQGLIVAASGFRGNLTVQVGFTGEPMQVCVLEGKTRFLTGIGLHLLQGES